MKGDLKLNNKSNVTLSIDAAIFDEIKKYAEDQGHSVNALLNTVLTKYVLLYGPAESQEGMLVPHKFFSGLLKYIPDDDLLKLIREDGFEAIRAVFVQGGIALTMDNMITYLFERIALWAGTYYKFRSYPADDGWLCLAFEHSYGIKWSKALGESLSIIIKETLNHDTEHKITASTVLIRVNVK
ncbi:MAG: hypothetical protein KGI02_10340 [Thaumarchaeota archaeon]|nr:hypothetical protein [Nitrososphaerota archaeon]MDE1878892.1 hypothetical protein [Nitrososphaerota archaeon]